MTEEKDSICCSWYESCTYYMQCEHLYNENKDLSEDVYRLEQENKELKEEKDKYYQQTLDDEILMNELSLEVDLRKKESDFYLEKLSKYRSALEEIREIANENNFCASYACPPMFKILDKINEVLGDN